MHPDQSVGRCTCHRYLSPGLDHWFRLWKCPRCPKTNLHLQFQQYATFCPQRRSRWWGNDSCSRKI